MEPEALAAHAPARRRWRWLPALLLLATAYTTVTTGADLALGDRAATADALGRLLAGLPYASALLAILGAHEMGHWLMGRTWGVDSTLPHFIPGPGPAGTFGAVIRIRSPMPSRRAVLDIGIAGQLAGLVVALPLLALGLSRSEVRPMGDALLEGAGLESPLALLRGWLAGRDLFGEVSGAQLMGDSLLTWGMQRLLLGPLPPGHEVVLHPVAFAGWIGLLVTTLNLLPIGQLDGGHVLYAWLGGERAERASRLLSWALLLAGLTLSWTWLVWWLIARFLVRLRHPPATFEEEGLDRGRVVLAILALVLFALTFVPVPVSV
ncbi:MAG: site-2 protease family protein [Deltaproteobacteria bacterium]|nr:site-2 protease family protein [Deltaproteobacteria bacterium]